VDEAGNEGIVEGEDDWVGWGIAGFGEGAAGGCVGFKLGGVFGAFGGFKLLQGWRR